MDVRTGKIVQAALPALLSALFFLSPSPAAAAAVAAKASDSLVESIGVNTHTYYTNTVYYSRFETVKQKLGELGVRHIRENLMAGRPDQYERLRELAGIGARSTLILGDPIEGTENLDQLISIVKTELGGVIAAVEGPNEYDMRGGPSWAPDLRTYQQRLYASIGSDSALSGLTVVGPSLVQQRNQEALGDISGELDYGNVHSYPDGYSPEANLDRHFRNAANNSGSEQLMATETGYHTAVGWSGEHKPVSEEAMATYVPRMFLEYFRRGIARTFSYELLDEAPGAADREDSFGLLRNDLSPKPAFGALRNLIEILEDPGPAFATASLPYTLGGKSKDVQQLLLQKRDGTFYLALWRAVDVWDPVAQTPLAAPGGSVTVDFGRLVTSADAYLPNASATPVTSLQAEDGAVKVDVGPQVVILAVSAGSPRPERLKLWVSRRSVPAGGRVAVRGRLPAYANGHSRRVTLQHLRRGAWQTVGFGRSTRSGVFRKAIRLSRARFGRLPRLRIVARNAKPSRAVRVRIKGSRSRAESRYRIGLTGATSVSG